MRTSAGEHDGFTNPARVVEDRVPDKFETLSLLSAEQLSRWQGLPVQHLGTPDGVWQMKFAPPTTTVSMLDSGAMGSRLTVRGRTSNLDIDAGSFALFSPGLEVKVQHLGSYRAQRILLDLDTRFLFRQGLLDDDLVAIPLQQSTHFQDPSLAAVLRAMVNEIRQGCPNGALFAESLSIGAALHLRRTRGVLQPGAGRERGKLNSWQWTRVNELIAANLASNLSLATLAATAGLSKPHFVRLFRNTAGTSPHRFVLQKRVEHARQLLQASKLPLLDVAHEAGFANQSHLTRMFQEVYGVTPGEMKRRSRPK